MSESNVIPPLKKEDNYDEIHKVVKSLKQIHVHLGSIIEIIDRRPLTTVEDLSDEFKDLKYFCDKLFLRIKSNDNI